MTEDLVNEFVKLADVNKDGVVDLKDFKDRRFLKWILVTMLSIMSPLFLNSLIEWGSTGTPDFDAFGNLAKYMVGPFLIGVLFKGIFEDYDKKLKKANDTILERDIIILKKNDEINQLKITNELKKQEIEFMTKYGTQIKE